MNGDQQKVHDWIQIQITFKAKCTECQKEVLPGQAFWSSSQKAARHLTCNGSMSRRNNNNDERYVNNLVTGMSNSSDIASRYQEKIMELKCFICGSRTGCSKCEYLVGCQQRLVSKYCVCDECIISQQDPFNSYQECFTKKSRHLK